jgi:predicted metalloprotease with PDZ domain
MNGVDLARFEFDGDTTWHAFFLDAQARVYSRYGGRDETSADARQSKESLLQTMREVLEAHARQGREGPAAVALFQPVAETAGTPEDIPLLAANHSGCVHCHHVQEYRLLQACHDNAFERSLLFGYPLPENLGLSLDRSHGHKIKSVAVGSAADRAGFRPGDDIVRFRDVPIRSEQDLRWVLHRTPERATVEVRVQRMTDAARGQTTAAEDGAFPTSETRLTLHLAGDWRQTELGWRKSLRSVPVPWGFLGYPLGREERDAQGLSSETLAIRIASVRGEGLAKNLALQKSDLIVALDGRTTARSLEEFKSDLLRRYAPGDRVRLTVARGGHSVELTGPFPDWHAADLVVP